MRGGKKGALPPEDSQGMALLEELLAMLLPEADARRAFGQLKSRLGRLRNILPAPEAELARLPGMTAQSARFLRLSLELARAYMEDAAEGARDIPDFACFVELLRPAFLGSRTERVAALLLDSGGRYLYGGPVFEGSIGGVTLNFRRLAGLCDSYDASGIVIAHNHPTGDVLPSTEDIAATGQALRALMGIGVDLRDHIIFTERDEFSFAESGLLADMLAMALEEQRQRVKDTNEIAAAFWQERQ